jgi:hypothetical protein
MKVKEDATNLSCASPAIVVTWKSILSESCFTISYFICELTFIVHFGQFVFVCDSRTVLDGVRLGCFGLNRPQG